MLKSLAVAAALSTIGAANPVVEQASGTAQGAATTGAQQVQAPVATPRQQGRARPPLTPVERERRFRDAISNRISNTLRLTDTVMANRIASLSFRYRDSAMVIEDRERFVRMAMREEAVTNYGRVPNELRLRCLVDEFYSLQQRRLALRMEEDREISMLVPTLGRYRYLALQENLHNMMDEFVDDMRRARGGGGGRGRIGGPPPDSLGVAGGARVGPPGPPPGGARGQPPLFGRQLGAGRGQYANLCPPR